VYYAHVLEKEWWYTKIFIHFKTKF